MNAVSLILVAVTTAALWAASAEAANDPEPYYEGLCAHTLDLSGEEAKELLKQTGTVYPTTYRKVLAKKLWPSVEPLRQLFKYPLYPIAFFLPETGETLVVETPKQTDLPAFRLWLLDSVGNKKNVELPPALNGPPLSVYEGKAIYPWDGRFYPWSSHGLFLIFTTKGLYGLRNGKISLIEGDGKLPERIGLDLGSGFHDLGADQDAIVFGSTLGPTHYVVINEQRGVIKSEQLPFMKTGVPGEPHPDGKSVIVFGEGHAYRVGADAPPSNIMPVPYSKAEGTFAGATIPWWQVTLLNTFAGIRLLTRSGALFRVRGMEGLDPRKTYFTFGVAGQRVHFWTAPGLKPFGEIVAVAAGAACR